MERIRWKRGGSLRWEYFRQTIILANLPAHDRLSKCAKAAVIGLFHAVGEAAGWQFLHVQMIGQTFTAHSFA